MTTRLRPLIAVRLIGPTDAVAAHKAHLIEHFQAVYGPAVICRSSTRHGSRVGECRTYLSITTQDDTVTPNPLQHNENPTPDRPKDTP